VSRMTTMGRCRRTRASTRSTNEPTLRPHEWVVVHWPAAQRRRIAAIVAIVVFALAALPFLARVAGEAIELGALPYVALIILCWIGEGGALVPIPGVRLLSWVTIVQMGGTLEPLLVAALAGLAMTLGQSSYFVVTRSGERLIDRHIPPGRLREHLPFLVPAPAGDPGGGAEPAEADARDGGRLARASASVKRRLQAHPRATIVAVSTVPSPLTTITTVAAASAGVPFRTFFLAALTGFLILSTVLAIAGQAILTILHL
jgi:membrane protein DedA with SNARE-associated domain